MISEDISCFVWSFTENGAFTGEAHGKAVKHSHFSGPLFCHPWAGAVTELSNKCFPIDVKTQNFCPLSLFKYFDFLDGQFPL